MAEFVSILVKILIILLLDFDFDSDESADDGSAGAYESILDEAVAVLPERSLRWHYRSRHEHLIAFSNIFDTSAT